MFSATTHGSCWAFEDASIDTFVSSVLSVKVVSVMVLVSSVMNKIVPSSLHIDATLNVTQGNCIFSRSW